MKCLLLGAGGYLGGHLAQALQRQGHEVVVHGAAAGPGQPRADLSRAQALAAVDWAVDRVFVFAGSTGTGASFANFRQYVEGNEIVLLNVLEGIRQSAHRPRVVFPSTRLVYRGADAPLPETAALEAKTVYAASKIACEACLGAYANAFDIPHTVFRICVPYGNTLGSQYSFGTVGNFIRQALDTGRIRLYGDGSLRRTFSHVDDLCRAIVLGAQRDDFCNEVFNLPGEDLSLLQAAELIASRLQARVEFAPWPALDLRIESGSTVFDAGKLLARLPGVATHTLRGWSASITRPDAT